MRVTLAPGDLLLSASTVLFGAAPAAPEARLASCEYVCATSYPIAGYDCAEPTPVSHMTSARDCHTLFGKRSTQAFSVVEDQRSTRRTG